MTINEAVARVDEIRPNQYSAQRKQAWVLTVEKLIKHDVYDVHEHSDDDVFTDFESDTLLDDKLYVDDAYSDLYVYYLCTMIDWNNAENGRYNNDAEMYNSTYSDYIAWYNRTHKPKCDNTLTYFAKAVTESENPLS